jgi:hypothetical protein
MTSGLPASVPYDNPPAVIAWSIRLEQQPAFSITFGFAIPVPWDLS